MEAKTRGLEAGLAEAILPSHEQCYQYGRHGKPGGGLSDYTGSANPWRRVRLLQCFGGSAAERRRHWLTYVTPTILDLLHWELARISVTFPARA